MAITMAMAGVAAWAWKKPFFVSSAADGLKSVVFISHWQTGKSRSASAAAASSDAVKRSVFHPDPDLREETWPFRWARRSAPAPFIRGGISFTATATQASSSRLGPSASVSLSMRSECTDCSALGKTFTLFSDLYSDPCTSAGCRT